MEARARADHNDVEHNETDRNRLVRAPKFVDTTIFGGWGIKL
jgi:hypothetical protein